MVKCPPGKCFAKRAFIFLPGSSRARTGSESRRGSGEGGTAGTVTWLDDHSPFQAWVLTHRLTRGPRTINLSRCLGRPKATSHPHTWHQLVSCFWFITNELKLYQLARQATLLEHPLPPRQRVMENGHGHVTSKLRGLISCGTCACAGWPLLLRRSQPGSSPALGRKCFH